MLSDNNTRKRTIVLTLSLLGIALAIRLVAFGRLDVIARDGILYLALAQGFLSGSFQEALSHPYHPLYAILVAMAGSVVNNLELGGRVVSLVLSCLTVIPLFFFGRSVAGTRVGFIAGLFFAFQPYSVRFSVDVLSDPAFLFFFMTALGLGAGGRNESRSVYWSFGAGVSAGLAYLTRPEGVFAVGFLALWYGARWWGDSSKGASAGFFRRGSVLIIAFFLVASPYLSFIKAYSGELALTMKPSFKKSIRNLPLMEDQKEGNSVPYDSSAPRATQQREPGPLAPANSSPWVQNPSFWQSILSPVNEFMETYPFILFFFFLSGCWAILRQGVLSYSAVLVVFAFVYLAALCYLFDSVGYVARRHFIPLITMSLPVAGVGFWELEGRLRIWAVGKSGSWSPLLARRAALIMMIVTVGLVTPKALKQQGVDKIPFKEAGAWIKANSTSISPTVMCNEPRVAYYANGKQIAIPPLPYRQFVLFVKEHGVDYIVFREREIDAGKEFLNQLAPGCFRRVPFEREHVQIFEVVCPNKKQQNEQNE